MSKGAVESLSWFAQCLVPPIQLRRPFPPIGTGLFQVVQERRPATSTIAARLGRAPPDPERRRHLRQPATGRSAGTPGSTLNASPVAAPLAGTGSANQRTHTGHGGRGCVVLVGRRHLRRQGSLSNRHLLPVGGHRCPRSIRASVRAAVIVLARSRRESVVWPVLAGILRRASMTKSRALFNVRGVRPGRRAHMPRGNSAARKAAHGHSPTRGSCALAQLRSARRAIS
jgi:hypothetical protein